MSDTLNDFVCIPAKCMKTSREFFVECYKAYDQTWVYAYGKVRDTARGSGSHPASNVLLTPKRIGPQFACPHCGGAFMTTCWNCGKEICYDGDDHDGREIVCPICNATGVFRTGNKQNANMAFSGNGQ